MILPIKYKMTKVKTASLMDLTLDWAVAKCRGVSEYSLAPRAFLFDRSGDYNPNDPDHHYSSDWAQGGPILDEAKISTEENGQGYWVGRKYQQFHQSGNTKLIAGLRSFVASVMGDEVEVPAEFVK